MAKIDVNDVPNEAIGQMFAEAGEAYQTDAAKMQPLVALLDDPELFSPPARIKSEYTALDAALNGGFCPKGLYVVAALTGRGKSTLLLNLMRRMATETKTLLISLENDSIRSARKILAAESDVAEAAIEHQSLTGAERSRIADGLETLKRLNVNVLSEAGELSEIIRLIEIAAEAGTRVIILDQSSWVHVEAENQIREASKIARTLKQTAKRLGIVVLVALQVNRSGAAAVRDGQDIELFHLRDSGKWEEDSDAVLIIQPGEQHDDGSEVMNVDLKKHRHGRYDYRIVLRFKASNGRIEDDVNSLSPIDLRAPKAAQTEEPKWNADRFCAEFVGDEPELEAAIIGRAEDAGLSERQAKKLLRRGVGEKKVYEWNMGHKQKMQYCKQPQPTEKNDSCACAHTP